MRPGDIDDLAAMLAGTGIVELTLTAGGETLTLRRHPSPRPPAAAGVVTARCPGLFLVRHPLRDADLAGPGPVASGAVVALLRVGPLLVPVAAPGAGVLGDRLAEPGALVGSGTPLFRFQPQG